jgi:hypothetical protein
MFNSAGTHKAIIDDVKFAEPKFSQGENDFDICIHVRKADDEAQSDWWRGEVSQNYGKGNAATKTQAELTMGTLRKIGFDGEDLTTLKDQLVGKEIPVTIKASEKDGKTYYNVQYLGGGGGIGTELDTDAMQKRMAALFGGGQSKPKAAPQIPSASNPFAPSKSNNPFG